jgi:hypothetical protein
MGLCQRRILKEQHMRRHRLLALAGLLVLAGCSGDEPRSLGPVPTAPATSTTTTTLPVTSTAPATTATSAPATTVRAPVTTTTAGPVMVDGIPQVTVTPSRAPVGGRVRVEGSGFTDPMWRAADAPLWLAGGSGCNFYAQATHSVTVSAAGRLTGEFTVPGAGACRMSDVFDRPVTSGAYRIVFVCTPCVVGEVEVTTTAGLCLDVGYTPNADDVAGQIMATGVDCAEAEALVRKVGTQAVAVGGPARLEVDGFVCVKTAQNDGRGLPSADYSCTSGAKKVTFHRI